jgi:hypothetical protein
MVKGNMIPCILEFGSRSLDTFSLKERARDTLLVGLRVHLDAGTRRKLPYNCDESNPDFLVVQPVA